MSSIKNEPYVRTIQHTSREEEGTTELTVTRFDPSFGGLNNAEDLSTTINREFADIEDTTIEGTLPDGDSFTFTSHLDSERNAVQTLSFRDRQTGQKVSFSRSPSSVILQNGAEATVSSGEEMNATAREFDTMLEAFAQNGSTPRTIVRFSDIEELSIHAVPIVSEQAVQLETDNAFAHLLTQDASIASIASVEEDSNSE